MLTWSGKVIYPSFDVINVICSSLDDFSSMTPNSGSTVYFARTLDYYDCGMILNLAFISEWLFRIIVFVYG